MQKQRYSAQYDRRAGSATISKFTQDKDTSLSMAGDVGSTAMSLLQFRQQVQPIFALLCKISTNKKILYYKFS